MAGVVVTCVVLSRFRWRSWRATTVSLPARNKRFAVLRALVKTFTKSRAGVYARTPSPSRQVTAFPTFPTFPRAPTPDPKRPALPAPLR